MLFLSYTPTNQIIVCHSKARQFLLVTDDLPMQMANKYTYMSLFDFIFCCRLVEAALLLGALSSQNEMCVHKHTFTTCHKLKEEVLGVGSIPVAILHSCQYMKINALHLQQYEYTCSWVVKIRTTSEAVLRPKYTPWPSY